MPPVSLIMLAASPRRRRRRLANLLLLAGFGGLIGLLVAGWPS